MNVLIYSGQGTTSESLKQCIESLKLHLSPYYAVSTISERALLHDPWMGKTSMLVMPGGADIPYCMALNGEGNRCIEQFVRRGGRFMGICAGGYYASRRCEFEVGNREYEVSGSRELAFFPGTAKGCAFKGFKYDSHQGARVTQLKVNTGVLPGSPESVYAYYNGGCLFEDALKYPSVQILARYTEKTDIEDEEKAAVIYSKIGRGHVILSGPHPEYSYDCMNRECPKILQSLKTHDSVRKLFMRQCLSKLDLKVNNDLNLAIPFITPIHISGYLSSDMVTKFMFRLCEQEVINKENVMVDNHDTFHFHLDNEEEYEYVLKEESDNSKDADSAVKHVKIHSQHSLPGMKETPNFSMTLYFSCLKSLREKNAYNGDFGSMMAYADVVSSTSTILDANPHFLDCLPHGFVFTASTQVAGKGRGGNIWVNPKGVMALSIVFRIPTKENLPSSLATLQYLCSLALIELILGYAAEKLGECYGYENLPVKIKWPNDLYVLKPEFFNSFEDSELLSETVEGNEERYVKISGSLINSQVDNGMYNLICGIGVNLSNEGPTVSLNRIVEQLNCLRKKRSLPPLLPIQPEVLLAKLVFTLGVFFDVYRYLGIRPFLPLYYKRWFHSSQLVSLDREGNGKIKRCLIKGITPDNGLLIAQDMDTRETYELQPDGNSFDIFKGMIYRKC